jgi:hypothetical protein
MSTIVRSDLILCESSYTHTIDVPIEKVDIATWLFTLTCEEYQRCCPPDHVAAGTTTADDGRPMSIQVEMIGSGLLVHGYVAETLKSDHARMVSTSDLFAPAGRASIQVIWDLSVRALGDGRCLCTNAITSHPTEEYMEFLDDRAIGFEEAATERQAAAADHNRRETLRFAESIARAARTRPVARAA